MNYIATISKMMTNAGLDSIDLIYERKTQTIQKGGTRFEILTIYAPEEGDSELMLTTIPSYDFKLVHLCVDDTWRASTLEKLTRIVRDYIQGQES